MRVHHRVRSRSRSRGRSRCSTRRAMRRCGAIRPARSTWHGSRLMNRRRTGMSTSFVGATSCWRCWATAASCAPWSSCTVRCAARRSSRHRSLSARSSRAAARPSPRMPGETSHERLVCPASAAHLSLYPRLSPCAAPTASPVRRALRYYHDMQQQGVTPDTQTVNSLINAFAKVGDVERAFRVAASMERRALTPTVVTYNSPADPPLTLSPRRSPRRSPQPPTLTPTPTPTALPPGAGTTR